MSETKPGATPACDTFDAAGTGALGPNWTTVPVDFYGGHIQAPTRRTAAVEIDLAQAPPECQICGVKFAAGDTVCGEKVGSRPVLWRHDLCTDQPGQTLCSK